VGIQDLGMKTLSTPQRAWYFWWSAGNVVQIAWLWATCRNYSFHLEFFRYNFACARTGLRTDQPDTDFDWGMK